MDGIADYTFIRPLAEGNHGRYYLAVPPPRLGLEAKAVVVKVVAGRTTSDTFTRATRELKAFASVRSPFLVRLYDAGQQTGTFFYAMEWLERGSLADHPQELSKDDARKAVADVARAAHALHEAGIVHQDIAPENVLLTGEGGRLADLGLAKVLQPGVTVTSIGSRSIGAVEFVDPAMLAGGRPSRLTDIYSIGMTLHRALTGIGMFGEIPSDQPMMAMRAVLSGSPKIDPSLGPQESALIKACVDPDPTHRPRTAQEVAQRIDALAAPIGTLPASPAAALTTQAG
jgi:eukaryotic-like serine/threonine-protein kinase